jgi:hypothetical protein
MIVLGMGMVLFAYSAGSWGYCLVKGWNIPLRAWVSPLNPYQWPAGGADPKCVPPGYIFPTTKAAGVDCTQKPTAKESTSPGQQRVNRAERQAHRPPGGVQSRF